jgi:DNA polymerase-3 subunit delta'
MWQGMGKLGANEACNLKFQETSHPDLLYPTVTDSKSRQKPKALTLLIGENLFLKILTGGLFDWYAILGVQKARGEIESMMHKILKSLSLKSYEAVIK